MKHIVVLGLSLLFSVSVWATKATAPATTTLDGWSSAPPDLVSVTGSQQPVITIPQMTIKSGWNMISSPINGKKIARGFFGSKSVLVYNIYAFDSITNQYTNPSYIDVGIGYWAQGTKDTTVSLATSSPTASSTITIDNILTTAVAGKWNLLGTPIDITKAQLTSKGATAIWWFDPSVKNSDGTVGAYSTNDTIKAGSGFWCKTISYSASGNMLLYANDFPQNKASPNVVIKANNRTILVWKNGTYLKQLQYVDNDKDLTLFYDTLGKLKKVVNNKNRSYILVEENTVANEVAYVFYDASGKFIQRTWAYYQNGQLAISSSSDSSKTNREVLHRSLLGGLASVGVAVGIVTTGFFAVGAVIPISLGTAVIAATIGVAALVGDTVKGINENNLEKFKQTLEDTTTDLAGQTPTDSYRYGIAAVSTLSMVDGDFTADNISNTVANKIDLVAVTPNKIQLSSSTNISTVSDVVNAHPLQTDSLTTSSGAPSSSSSASGSTLGGNTTPATTPTTTTTGSLGTSTTPSQTINVTPMSSSSCVVVKSSSGSNVKVFPGGPYSQTGNANNSNEAYINSYLDAVQSSSFWDAVHKIDNQICKKINPNSQSTLTVKTAPKCSVISQIMFYGTLQQKWDCTTNVTAYCDCPSAGTSK